MRPCEQFAIGCRAGADCAPAAARPTCCRPRRARRRGAGPLPDPGHPRRHHHPRQRRPAAAAPSTSSSTATASPRSAPPARPACRCVQPRPGGRDARDRRHRHVCHARLRRHARPQRRPGQGADPSYPYRLWLAHGVTTVRGVPLFGERRRPAASMTSAAAPPARSPRRDLYLPDARLRLVGRPRAHAGEGARLGALGRPSTASTASSSSTAATKPPRSTAPRSMKPRSMGLGTVAHLSQPNVADFNARDAAAAGLGTITHFYGHFESLLKDRTHAGHPGRLQFQRRAEALWRHRRHLEPDLRARRRRNGGTISRRRRPPASCSIRPSTSTAPAAT